MANVTYNEGAKSLLAGSTGEIDYIVDTIKAMMVGAGYVADPDHQFIDEAGADDPVDHETAGATRQTLANKVIGKDTTNDFAYLDADDPVFTAVTAGPAVEGVIIFKDTGTPTTSKMLCYLDISVTPNGGNITIQFATPANGGIMRLNTVP